MNRLSCSLLLTVLACGGAAAQPKPAPPKAPTPIKPVAKPVPPAACLIVNGPGGNNTAFERATELAKGDKEPDREYAIAERGTHNGVTFYLRHGHGVVRLEAWVGGNRVGMTFFPAGRVPAFSDYLSLEVRDPKGGYVEAACNDAAKLHGL